MQLNNPDLSDLLANESFLRYCRGGSPEDTKFWENYITANPGEQELIESAKDHFILLFNTLAEADLREQEERLKSRLNGLAPVISISEKSPRKRKAGRRFWMKTASVAAVSVTVILGSVYFIMTHRTKALKTYSTAYGERKNIQLPDGSVVNLNSGSKIQLSDNFDLACRDVYLTGEAFFDVRHNRGKPFIVHTEDMDVKALGTAFDIKAYREENRTETSLIRGIVEVTLKKDNKKLLLHPSEKITWKENKNATGESADAVPVKREQPLKFLPEKIKPTELGDIKEIAWKDNKLVFDNDRLDEIAPMIERWYGVRMVFRSDAIRAYRFTGVFEREDLKTLLDYLKESRKFSFQIDNGENLTVYLSV